MKKIIILLLLSLSLALTSCMEQTTVTVVCDHEGMEANYICDMVCPKCGKVFSKLDPTNEYLNSLDEYDGDAEFSKFKEYLLESYLYINDSFNVSGEDLEALASKLMPLYNDTINQYSLIMMSGSNYETKYQIYRTLEAKEAADNYEKIQNVTNNLYMVYLADIFYSPLKPYFFEEEYYSDLDEMLKDYQDASIVDFEKAQYEEGEEISSTNEDIEKLTIRQNELYSILHHITSIDDSIYDSLYEYIQISNQLTPEKYNSYYDYYFTNLYGITRTQEEFNNYGNNIIKYLVNNYDFDYSSSLAKVKEEGINVYRHSAKDNNTELQLMVDFLKTIKNEKSDYYEIINNLYKEGRIFYSDNSSVSTACYDEYIMFSGASGTYLTSFVHEFGHYCQTYRAYSQVLDEVCSLGLQALFNAYATLFNHPGTDDYQATVNYYINYYMEQIINYSLYNEISSSLYHNYSSLDECFKDGIDQDEYELLIDKVFEKYGVEKKLNVLSQVMMYLTHQPSYDISYSYSAFVSLGIYLTALDNYETGVAEYLTFANNYYCRYSKDRFVLTINKSNLLNPFDESGFNGLCELLNNHYIK